MIRTGIGYDVHQLAKGNKLIIANIEIPFEFGSVGHSDGDTLTHAIIDAMLGAAALGDLGDYFPSIENKWKGSNSLNLLKEISIHIKKQGFTVNNIDGTIIIQKPRLKKYIPFIRKNLADVLGLSVEYVSVKATTVDAIGAIGEGKGWGAQAIVTLSK
jgi:2-C-methyl-D-erythritol 2,4-cyclodiphosphate synthase